MHHSSDNRPFLRVLGALLVALFCTGLVAARQSDDGDEPKYERVPMAIVVNPRNPTTNLTLGELRSHLFMKRGHWPNGEACEILLRPNDSLEMRVLLDVVYQKSEKQLAKYWIQEVFRGRIKDKPAVVATTAAVGTQVAANVGAMSVVPASEVPDGVRVLTIDDMAPDDAKYPLFALVRVEPEKEEGEEGGDGGGGD